MSDCIFCKIAAGEIPSTKVYEDDNWVFDQAIGKFIQELSTTLKCMILRDRQKILIKKEINGSSAWRHPISP